jgi:hypothetical protein
MNLNSWKDQQINLSIEPIATKEELFVITLWTFEIW